jgi:molecular chaperone GrpE
MKRRKSQKPEEQKEPKAEKSESEKLRDAIEDLQKEKDELFGKLQRVGADYENFQKRVPKQIADTIAYEKEKIIKTLLPVLDNFEHTLQNSHSAEHTDVLVKGIRIIYDQMLAVLKGYGVEQIKALGEDFDPAFHEAVMQRQEPEQAEGIVLEEFQKGYTLNGRVIRPSKVIVNKPSSEQEVSQEEPAEQEQTTDESTDVE